MEHGKEASAISHAVAILVLPFNVTVIIPGLLLYFLPYQYGWGLDGLTRVLLSTLGALILLLGVVLLISTITMFAAKGKGTLAPWDPPRRLVVDGPYRYTRNPMISGVVLILLGEVIIFGSIPLLLWFLYFTLTNILYIIKREEPHLEEKYGADYREYKRHVPRIWPRRTPWNPGKR